MSYPIISADSHVTEPPNAYIDNIDPAYRDRAPHLEHVEGAGDMFVIEGLKVPIPLGIVAAAGKPAEQIRLMGTRFEELHRGGWDPEARLADQERDGVAAEVIYPTVGMAVCNHRDLDYKKACCDAFNRWMAQYCGAHPERLLGVGQTAMRTPAEGIRDLESIKAVGLRGVMLPGVPGVEDYDSPAYDEFWEAVVALGLPPSFHILTTRETPTRGPGALEAALGVLRGGHLHHLPGRLGRLPQRRHDELAAAHVGERLPAQRLDLAVVAGAAGRAHRRAHRGAAARDPLRERRRALPDRPRGARLVSGH